MSNKESATLALAKSVGAISSRKVRKADPNQNSNGPSNPSQAFPFLIVLDFESTCWEEKKNSPPNEIIEFPAVLLDTSSGAVVDEFHTYVMPTEQPKLSPFCRELTGIAQDQVDAGVPLPTCLNLFNRWIIKVTKQHKLVMNDIKTGHNSVTFVTW